MTTVEKYLLTLANCCFTFDHGDGLLGYHGSSPVGGYVSHNMAYFYGCRRHNYFALKIGDTFVEKWSDRGMSVAPPHAKNVEDKVGFRGFWLEFEHPEFLASMFIKIRGANPGFWEDGKIVGSDIGRVWFEPIYCEFVGSEEALETEALLANLSHDF